MPLIDTLRTKAGRAGSETTQSQTLGDKNRGDDEDGEKEAEAA